MKSSADTDSTPKMMKYGYFALQGRDWEEYKSIFKVEISAIEWAFERIREAFEKVAKDEACGVSSRQPEDKEVLLCRICAQIAAVLPWRDYTWWVSAGERSTAVAGAQSVEKI